MQYLKALRLPAGLFLALMAIASFNINGVNIHLAILPALVTLLMSSATMVWNDLCDCERDALAGKNFALLHRRTFQGFSYLVWALACLSAAWLINTTSGITTPIVALLMFGIGINYQRTERIIALPMLAVATASSLCVCFALSATTFSLQTILLFLIVFSSQLAREIIKDLEDMAQDSDPTWGKATLPLRIGVPSSLTVVHICLWFCALCIAILAMGLNDATIGPMMVISVMFVIASTIMANSKKEATAKSKFLLDIGLGILAVTLGLLWSILHH